MNREDIVVPSGYQVSVFKSGLNFPTGIAFRGDAHYLAVQAVYTTAMLGVVYVLGVLSYHLVEKRFLALKQRFGDEFLLHIEFMKNAQGVVFPGSIPVVRFSTEKRLNEMIDYCREIGVGVANPHVNNVEGGGRYRSDNVQLMAKHRYDTKGLLNPGKMVTFERHTAGAPIA